MEFNNHDSQKHTPPAVVEEYIEGKGSMWMKPSYIGGSEYNPQEDGGFVKNPKDDSMLHHQNMGLFNRIRDTEYHPNMMIDRSSHTFMSTTNMNGGAHQNHDLSVDKKSDLNVTKSKASILDDTLSASKNQKYFADHDNE